MPNKPKTYRILSLDGGGICGLITAVILQRLDKELPKFLKGIDLIAGTSTGGVIALALAKGIPPADLVNLYKNKGPKIFPHSVIDELLGVLEAKYSNKGLKREIKKQIGDTTLGQLKKRVLIPTFQLDNQSSVAKQENPGPLSQPRTWKPKFYHNFPGKDSDGKVKAMDVAMRTSAAPTYFPSYQGFVDGGVVANNPSIAAIAQALDKRAGKQKLENLRVLSLGTGLSPQHISGSTNNWGLLEWARPITNLMLSGSMGVAEFQCHQLLGEGAFKRVDPLVDPTIDMDDVSKESIDRLYMIGHQVKLKPVVDWLEKNYLV
jgi:uncharacterized protein